MPPESLVLDLQAAVAWLGAASGLLGVLRKWLLRYCDVQDSALPKEGTRGATRGKT